MDEPRRNPDPEAPQNPPKSVLNEGVRKSALWTYLTPLILFFIGVAVILAYWNASPPRDDGDIAQPAVEGTAGGHNPDPVPESPEKETGDRGGRVIDKLDQVFADESRDVIGRRVEIRGLRVDRLESPTLFWVRDDRHRIAVVSPTSSVAVREGQTLDITGTVERSGSDVRIRASRLRGGSDR